VRPARPGLALLAAALALVAAVSPGPARAAPASSPPAQRVVSLNPSLTAILLALGARDALVGVDSFSQRQEPALAALPSVGGLYNPSVEAVVALAPDLVAFVPSAEQRDFQRTLEGLGLPVLALDPLGFEDVLATIETLGARVGRVAQARARVEAIRAARRAVEARAAGRPRPRTVLVLQRDPLFVVGRGSFADDMLASAGADNAARAFAEPYPRVAREWLLAVAPELILDASEASGAEDVRSYWARWPSLPAVRAGRVLPVAPGAATLPGPWLDRGLEALERAVRGEPDTGTGGPRPDAGARPASAGRGADGAP
jgi:iron complex transport system substrate-binding protein